MTLSICKSVSQGSLKFFKRTIASKEPAKFLNPFQPIVPIINKTPENANIKHVKYPYFVNRTDISKSLPVYMDRRGSGRNQILTIIRKIDGDLDVSTYLSALPFSRNSIAAMGHLFGAFGQ